MGITGTSGSIQLNSGNMGQVLHKCGYTTVWYCACRLNNRVAVHVTRLVAAPSVAELKWRCRGGMLTARCCCCVLINWVCRRILWNRVDLYGDIVSRKKSINTMLRSWGQHNQHSQQHATHFYISALHRISISFLYSITRYSTMVTSTNSDAAVSASVQVS